MVDALKDFFEASSIIDLIYIAITIWSLISCYRKGFVLSILSMAKWLLAYVITLILFPRIKPYVKDIIDNEYVLDVGLGIAIFIVVIFLVLLVNKGIGKALPIPLLTNKTKKITTINIAIPSPTSRTYSLSIISFT